MNAESFNKLAEEVSKINFGIKGNLLENIKELSAEAERISLGNNPVEKTFSFSVSSHTITGNIHKNGNVTLLTKSKGVVEEIIKRLQNDRHI